MKKNILYLCLTISLFATSKLESFSQLSDKNIIFASIVTILSPYMYKCCTKEDPQTRYDLQDLLNGTNIIKNLFYLYLDGFLGTPEKAESFKMKGKDGKKLSIKAKPKREATGIIGTAHANVKHIFKVSGWIAAIWVLLNYEELKGKDILKWVKSPNIANLFN